MRITRIAPRVFGRFTSETPLDIPRDPLVVVYGRNESGKSTYLDMTVALLAKDYDRALMERYGELDRTTFSGRISLEEGGETLTIEFGRGAKVPKRSSEVPRTPTPTGTGIWEKIASLDLATVRNLFRVSSTDISDGKATKAKFQEYGLGDRSGQSVTGAIDNLRARAKTAASRVSTLEQELNQHKSDLAVAQSTSDEYQRLTSRIAELEGLITDREAEIGSLDAEIRLVEFCNGAATTNAKAAAARSDLDAAQANGVLVPVNFGSVADTLRSLADSISRVDPVAAENKVTAMRNDMESEGSKVDADLQALGMDRVAFEANTILTSDVDRAAHFHRVRSAYSDLKSARDNAGSIDISGPRSDAEERSLLARGAREQWEKFGLGVAAQEFTKAPRLEPVPTPAVASSAGSPRNHLIAAGALVALAVASFALQQYIGGAALAVLAAVVFQRRPRKVASEVTAGPSTEQPGLGTVLQAASQVVTAESAESDAQGRLAAVLARHSELEKTVENRAREVEDLLAVIGLGDRGFSLVADFDSAATIIDRIASGLARRSRHAADLEIAENELARTTAEFSRLRDAVVENLAEIGLRTTAAQLPSPQAVIAHVNSLVDHYREQSGWRDDIAAHEAILAERAHDAERVGALMAMEKSDRDLVAEKSVSRSSVLDGEIRGFRDEVAECRRRAEELATTHRITELSLRISETVDKIREEKMTRARLEHLANVVETRAKERAELSRPELHRRVQDMVLAVADDWQSVGFPGDDEDAVVTYKNGTSLQDIFLSTGARTLLFTAMRIAIMQQEAEDPNAPSLPLLCDDPLLHLDDHRIAQAFRMMKQQAAGHQIIYFTCKQEIVDMAQQQGVPVVTIR